MYLLNRDLILFFDIQIFALHSTMYLLNHRVDVAQQRQYFTLHSTMYLLNPEMRSSYPQSLDVLYIPQCIY